MMADHDQLIQWGLALIGLLQALGLFLFGLIWSRLGTLDADLKAHVGNQKAHGNGMPRPEVEIYVKALADQASSMAEHARTWANENREDHLRINERLDNLIQALPKRSNQ